MTEGSIQERIQAALASVLGAKDLAELTPDALDAAQQALSESIRKAKTAQHEKALAATAEARNALSREISSQVEAIWAANADKLAAVKVTGFVYVAKASAEGTSSFNLTTSKAAAPKAKAEGDGAAKVSLRAAAGTGSNPVTKEVYESVTSAEERAADEAEIARRKAAQPFQSDGVTPETRHGYRVHSIRITNANAGKHGGNWVDGKLVFES